MSQWPIDKFGAVRPSFLRYSAYYGFAFGIGNGVIQAANYWAAALPAFEDSERKKGEEKHLHELEARDAVITDLRTKLEAYRPPRPVVLNQAASFHINDLDNEEGIEKWVNYLSEAADFHIEDSAVDAAFS